MKAERRYISRCFSFITIKCKGILAIENKQLEPSLSIPMVLYKHSSALPLHTDPTFAFSRPRSFSRNEMKFPEMYAICSDWWLTSIKLWLQCRSFIKIHPPYYIKLYGSIHSNGIRAVNISETMSDADKKHGNEWWWRWKGRDGNHSVRAIHSFVRFVSIRIFSVSCRCMVKLSGRARSISSSCCVPEKTQSTCTVCIIFHKNYCPHSTSLSLSLSFRHHSFYLQLASTNERYYVEKLYSQHIHIHGIAFLDALLVPSCLHTWIVCTFCSWAYRAAAAAVVASTFFLVVKQFPVKRVKVGDAFHHGIHSTVFDRHLHSLIQAYHTRTHPSLQPASGHSRSTFTHTQTPNYVTSSNVCECFLKNS